MERKNNQSNNSLLTTAPKLNSTNLVFFSFILALITGLSLFSGAKAVNAASLYLSPSSGSYTIGSNFSVSIFVSSPDQAINAASGVISFPQDKLEITSLQKSGSIFSLWVQEPTFSNNTGTINFEGIVLNPGFTGSDGKIITVNFKTKSAGSAPVTFSSGSVLANDGKGTNILASLGSARFDIEIPITGPAAQKATTPSEIAGTPPPPQIYSSSHPDPNKWYATSTAKFGWNLPPETTAVRLLVNDIPQTIPTVNYIPPISSKEITDLADGIWYLHVRLKNAQGWGAVSHFRFQIDTKRPNPFSIRFIDGKETENPRPIILFDTVDTLSGIEYYKIKIGEGDTIVVSQDIVKTNPYTLPPQNPGKHTIIVQAFDRAGNYAAAIHEFITKPIAPPTLADFPKQLQSDEILTFKGTTYPNSQVTVWLQREKDNPKSQNVKSDESGNFVFIADEKLRDGVYKIWAQVVNEQGAKSSPSQTITFVVQQPTLLKIGSWATNYLAVIIPLIALVILLALILWYSWYKFSRLRKKIKKEVREAEEVLGQAFDWLKEDVKEQIKFLEKVKSTRELTKEENEILRQLKKDLDKAEKSVRKEIEDIEKEIKK